MYELGISVSSLETRILGDRSHPYRKDRWRFHFIFVVIQVERETIMTPTLNTKKSHVLFFEVSFNSQYALFFHYNASFWSKLCNSNQLRGD